MITKLKYDYGTTPEDVILDRQEKLAKQAQFPSGDDAWVWIYPDDILLTLKALLMLSNDAAAFRSLRISILNELHIDES